MLLLLSSGAVAAEQRAEPPLPSCYMPLTELAPKCKGALVATLASVDSPEPGPPGASDYSSSWRVAKVLKGEYPAEVKLSFRVQTLPEEHRERMPAVGKTYILITYDSNANQIGYIFDYSEEKLLEVQDLLKR